MPFRWKKTPRCTRFTQLVADHLESQRQGGSLVVETGFPTSLVDLYVRSRGRLRKFSKKKQRCNDLSSPSSSPSDSLIGPENSSPVASDYRESDVIIEESVASGVDVNVVAGSLTETEESGVEIAYPNRVLVAALKVLLMAVLAFGTKRFAIGITVTAFLLLFLESLGLLRLLRPCWNPRRLLQSCFHGTKKTIGSQSNSTPVVCSVLLEIEPEEEKELDEVRCEVLMEFSHKKSRRAKMKSRILKLLPKKFRASKNRCLDSKGEIPCGFKEEDTLERFHDLKSQSLLSLLSNECPDTNGGSKEEQDKLVGPQRSLNLSNGTKHDDKELGTNSGCLVLCLIILIGLLGGRILAFVLAISWCLMLKMTQWRHVKLLICM